MWTRNVCAVHDRITGRETSPMSAVLSVHFIYFEFKMLDYC